MLQVHKSRGATANSSAQKLPKPHLFAIAAISTFVLIAALVMPSENVEAQRGETDTTAPVLLLSDIDLGSQADIANTLTLPEETLLPAVEEAAASMVEQSLPESVAAATEPEIQWTDFTVQRGDNLSLIFKRAGYTDRDLYRVVHQAPGGKALSDIFPGQTVGFNSDKQGDLLAVRHVVSALETVTYNRVADSFDTSRDVRTPELREAWASGTISSSLFLAGQKAGLSQQLIMELAGIFGGVIDFVQDPRKGDTIHVVYEELYLDGERFGSGEIVAASFTNQGKTFNAFRYEDSQGDISYYNEDGVSMRKAFLLAPVDFTRISSNFNLRRLHPIYKTTKPHRGTDYAAQRGTPVYAAGDGRVTKAGYSRANGNYVFIQHGDKYVTKYLHLDKRKVKQGQRVSQSQTIGTVGSTGAATGPHLHYEFLVNGVHRNPRTIHKQLPKARSLPRSEIARFQQSIGDLNTQLASLRNGNRLAMNSHSDR